MEIIELRRRFLEFFEQKGYQKVGPSSLIPQNDASVLFTTAGMQQFKDFYSSPDLSPSPKLTTVQPVIRTSDISEVGDDTHLTSFEMLGNFRFGEKDSFEMKKIAITEAWEFINNTLGVPASRVYATVFKDDGWGVSDDEESEKIWRELGVEVKKAGKEDNFWGPTGEEGPCGPTTEIYIDGVEVWNLVFNQYYKKVTTAETAGIAGSTEAGEYVALTQQGLDTGSGLERLAATLQGKKSVWEIEPFATWVHYTDPTMPRQSRIIIDHLRAIIFIVSAGILPGNKGREYILRRLIRKAVFLVDQLSVSFAWDDAIKHMSAYYRDFYQICDDEETLDVIFNEKAQFEKNIIKAKHYLEKWLQQNVSPSSEEITKLAFYMYESFGFPKELVIEHLSSLSYTVDNEYFSNLFLEHQKISRSGMEGQFKGGLVDHSEQTIKHHTAHHLLLAALRQVLGKNVVQKGSNVSSERLRIDFNFDRKLTEEELKEIEEIVNQKIKEDLPVEHKEMPKEEALSLGAQAEFGAKYGDVVSVYSIGDFSLELCGGPHVDRTGQLGRFEILKEEASSQGVRRIKAKLYN
ncbi:alanine--tRNA ligase [Candidatus Berkelbacteria bacterium]|nr:alanine--tRNA ligase [Candidatus Berkelbacteria bacterium]